MNSWEIGQFDFSIEKKTYFTKLSIMHKVLPKMIKVEQFELIIVFSENCHSYFATGEKCFEERISFYKQKLTCEISRNQSQIVIRQPRLTLAKPYTRLLALYNRISLNQKQINQLFIKAIM